MNTRSQVQGSPFRVIFLALTLLAAIKQAMKPRIVAWLYQGNNHTHPKPLNPEPLNP
jgi:hypothetical protein